MINQKVFATLEADNQDNKHWQGFVPLLDSNSYIIIAS